MVSFGRDGLSPRSSPRRGCWRHGGGWRREGRMRRAGEGGWKRKIGNILRFVEDAVEGSGDGSRESEAVEQGRWRRQVVSSAVVALAGRRRPLGSGSGSSSSSSSSSRSRRGRKCSQSRRQSSSPSAQVFSAQTVRKIGVDVRVDVKVLQQVGLI